MQQKERIPRDLKVKIWLKYATYADQIRTWTLCFCCRCCVKIPEEVRTHCNLYETNLLDYIDYLPACAYGHIIPESKGGKMEEDNLRIVCHRCNIEMGTQNMYDFCDSIDKSIIENYKDCMDVDPEPNVSVPAVMNVSGREEFCASTAKTGEPCRNKRPKDADFCWIHSGNSVLAN